MSLHDGASSPTEDGWQSGLFEAGDVVLQSGAVFKDARIAFEIHGTMNSDKSNIILHPTSFGAQSADLRYRIGPGSEYTLDSSLYCVVIVNLLGNGLSSSPSHRRHGKGSLLDFAMPSMYDNVMLHERLLREHLQVEKPVALIFGYSMGAMAALHFAALFPEKVARVAAVCGAAKVSHYNRVFLGALKAGLCADDAWDPLSQHFSSKPTRGLRAFGSIYAGWGLSPAFYASEEFLRPDVGDFKDLDDFLERGYIAGFETCEGHDLLAMLHTWDTADASSHARFRGDLAAALGSIRAKTLLMPCETDRYFTVEAAAREAALFQPNVAKLVPIPSSWGHRSGDPHRRGQSDQNRFITQQSVVLRSKKCGHHFCDPRINHTIKGTESGGQGRRGCRAMADSNRNSGVLTFKSAASILLQKVKVERASQFQAWNAPSAEQLPTELRNQTDIMQQEALCEQSKQLCMKVFESLHTDVLAVRRQMGVLPPGVPKSTVGLMLHGCLVDNVLTGGPACSMGFEKGDVIVQIDGHEVNTSNIHDYLLGDDIPGHFVEITIRKQGTGQIITVHLERASSAGIADRRRLFELFNALKVAAEKSHAAEKNPNPRGGGAESQIVDDIIALWTKMVQEDDSCTKQVKENVTNMQHDCYDELAKLKTVLEQLYWKIHENVIDAHDKGGASVPLLESEISRLKTLLAGANLDNENLRGRAKELETQNKNKDNFLKGLERERDDALMHVEHLCGQLEELQRSMKALQDARATTESERDKARAEMSKSSGALQELRTGNEEMAKKLEKAEESRDTLLAELARLKGYQKELEGRLATNDASLKKIVNEYQASNDEFEAEKGKYIFAQEQILMLSDNAKTLEHSKSLAVAAEHRVSGTLEELRSEHGKCLEELIKLQKEKDKAVAASEQCLGRLDEVQKQIGLKDEKIKKEEKEKIAAQKELERIRGQLLELENIKGQVASLGDLVEQLNKENAQLVSEVQTVRGQLGELRDKLAKEAAALQQALGDKEQALKDANVSRGAEKELREQLETLEDSMNSVQAERAKCKADLEKALGQLLEMEKIKAQLLDLRALHGEAAATLKNTEAKNMELQKELKALEGRHEELLGSYKEQSSVLKRMEVEKNAALSSEEKMRGQKDALAATCNECKESLQEQIADKERLMVLQGQLRGKMFELNEHLKKLLQDNKELLVEKEKAVAAAEEVKRKVSQLESSNDVLEQSLTSLKNECDEAKKKIAPLQKESERLKAHNTSLQQQIDAMKELQRRLEDAQSECANKDGAYDALQAQYNDKKGALQDVTQQLEILRKERDSSIGKLGELKKHLDGVKESLELAIKERHDAKVEVDTLKGQLEGINLPQLEGLIENLKGQLAACKGEMESLVKALKQADAEKESRNKEIEKLKGSLVDQGVLKMQFLELRDELERKDVALKQLREEKHLLNKDFESMKSLHEIRKDELAGTQQDLRLATQALESAQVAEAKIAVVLDDKERTYAAKSQDAKLLESDCMRISADYATVKAQLDGLKPQLSESQDTCSKTSAHLADALREKESLAQKADELKGQIEELRRQLAEREREANQLMSAKATALQNENALRGQLFESKANCQQTADLLLAANSEKARVAGLVQVVEGRMKEMQNIIADMQSQLKISNDERDTACRNMTIMKGQLAEKDAQLSELHQKQQELFDSKAICRKLDTELEICRAQLRTCTDQLQKAEEARKDAEEQATRVSREFASCHPTINELDSTNAELEQKLKEKEAKCKELELKYLESERRLNKCDETINIMRQQVEVANNTSSQKELEAKLAGSERENLLKEIDDLKRARDDLKKKFEEEVGKCKVEITQVKADRDRVRNEHMLCDKEIQKLRTETGELKIELAALIKECNQMRAERNNIAALQKNLEALLTENGFYKIQQETWRADELSLREQIANLEKRMKEVDEQAPQISQRAVAPQRAAPATQFSQRPLPVQPKAAMVGLGMIVKESGGRLVITEVSPGGGAWESGKVKVGDMLIGVASSPENPMFVIQSFDQVHDMLLGAAGTQAVVQIESKQTGEILTVTCNRKAVQSSTNPALRDNSNEPNQGRHSSGFASPPPVIPSRSAGPHEEDMAFLPLLFASDAAYRGPSVQYGSGY